jgi:hypothetical protein
MSQTIEAQIEKIMDIAEPWMIVNSWWEPWMITLEGGREIEAHFPLGAAVEIEEAGYVIKARGW